MTDHHAASGIAGSSSSALQLPPIRLTPIRLTLLLATVLLFSGCATRAKSYRAEFAAPVRFQDELSSDPRIRQAEIAYGRACQLESNDCVECLNQFTKCCTLLWPTLGSHQILSYPNRLYESAVGRLVETALRLNRFDSVNGIYLASPISGAVKLLPVRFHGYAWAPSEFHSFAAVGPYHSDLDPKCQHGVGASLVAMHHSQRPFTNSQLPFAATAIVRPSPQTGQSVLDIVNPTAKRFIDHPNVGTMPLAFDLTAPFAFVESENDTTWIEGFLQPDKSTKANGLKMAHPYQPGKIPVIFVHGLASDPTTWLAMANELMALPDLTQRFQFWTFSYPTGDPFLIEASHLRNQLVQARDYIDPSRCDAALDRMVLVGHSMGGLVSKLQVTASGDAIARSIGEQPPPGELPNEIQSLLVESIFWNPSNQIRRVIFLATPHKGSELASRPVGRFASSLIQQDSTVADSVSNLIADSRNGLTRRSRRLPTSVDLLRPDDPTLQAIYGLPFHPNVTIHTVAGIGYGGRLGHELSDGVVPLSSARHSNSRSELLVDSDHHLHRTPEAISEVIRILRLHAQHGL